MEDDAICSLSCCPAGHQMTAGADAEQDQHILAESSALVPQATLAGVLSLSLLNACA